jgi:hypothetical protein
MMTGSFDPPHNIRSILATCNCAACQCAFNRKRDKANEECKFGRGVKVKRIKTNGHKTRATCIQNGMINITLTGCCLVTLSLVPEILIYFTGRRRIITGNFPSPISGKC